MKKLVYLSLFALAPFAMVGCEPTVTEQKADMVEENAEHQADAIEESGDHQAESTEAHADATADAVREEGAAEAEAIRESDDPASDLDTVDPVPNP